MGVYRYGQVLWLLLEVAVEQVDLLPVVVPVAADRLACCRWISWALRRRLHTPRRGPEHERSAPEGGSAA
ncbi:hypothetical protein [Nocardia brevicatena]|uniref:hypothetical protein n=1 Tax=Nocardia brevicatena TaxID=37327 RepID=UPI0002D439E2|nr:hypothetical protein [Nocardia brevicatena]